MFITPDVQKNDRARKRDRKKEREQFFKFLVNFCKIVINQREQISHLCSIEKRYIN